MVTSIEEFGIVHCAGCEKPLGYFPPDEVIADIELYCLPCAKQLKEGETDV